MFIASVTPRNPGFWIIHVKTNQKLLRLADLTESQELYENPKKLHIVGNYRVKSINHSVKIAVIDVKFRISRKKLDIFKKIVPRSSEFTEFEVARITYEVARINENKIAKINKRGCEKEIRKFIENLIKMSDHEANNEDNSTQNDDFVFDTIRTPVSDRIKFERDRSNPRGLLEFECKNINTPRGQKPSQPGKFGRRDFMETVLGLTLDDIDMLDFFPKIEEGKYDCLLRLNRWATANFNPENLKQCLKPRWMKFGRIDDTDQKAFCIQFRKCNLRIGTKIMIPKPMFRPHYLDDDDKPDLRMSLENDAGLVLMKEIMDDRWHHSQMGGRGIKKGNWIAWAFPDQDHTLKDVLESFEFRGKRMRMYVVKSDEEKISEIMAQKGCDEETARTAMMADRKERADKNRQRRQELVEKRKGENQPRNSRQDESRKTLEEMRNEMIRSIKERRDRENAERETQAQTQIQTQTPQEQVIPGGENENAIDPSVGTNVIPVTGTNDNTNNIVDEDRRNLGAWGGNGSGDGGMSKDWNEEMQDEDEKDIFKHETSISDAMDTSGEEGGEKSFLEGIKDVVKGFFTSVKPERSSQHADVYKQDDEIPLHGVKWNHETAVDAIYVIEQLIGNELAKGAQFWVGKITNEQFTAIVYFLSARSGLYERKYFEYILEFDTLIGKLAEILKPDNIRRGRITTIKAVAKHLWRVGIKWPEGDSCLRKVVYYDEKGYIQPTKVCREIYEKELKKSKP